MLIVEHHAESVLPIVDRAYVLVPRPTARKRTFLYATLSPGVGGERTNFQIHRFGSTRANDTVSHTFHPEARF